MLGRLENAGIDWLVYRCQRHIGYIPGWLLYKKSWIKVIEHDLVDHDLFVQDPAPACLARRLCHPSGPSCDA